MRPVTFTWLILAPLLLRSQVNLLKAQQNCAFKPPVVKVDFGSGDIPNLNPYLSKYKRDFSRCPRDGYYSFTSSTGKCFNGDWLTLREDHSAERNNGNMMLVNASETGGVFFTTTMNGFKGNTTYQLTVSMMNVCRINGGCAPLPPNITINLLTPDGRKAGVFKTGRLTQGDVARWKLFAGFFKTPAGITSLKLIMENTTLGGCGNDFAMDDIIIRECVNAEPKKKKKEPALVQQKPVLKQPAVVKRTPVKPTEIKKDFGSIKLVKKYKPVTSGLVKIIQVKKDTAFTVTAIPRAIVADTITVVKNLPPAKLYEPIVTRDNNVVRRIETGAGELLVELYDNGEIDGDTVSIYHNNQMIISKAALSAKPVTLHIKADKMQPHHELIMIADNLGSIPPNTSMMIITANDKRYEISISSSEQKNAKVVIDLKQ